MSETKQRGLIAPATMKEIAILDETIRDSQQAIAEARNSGSQMLQALTMARSMAEIRRLLTPALMQDVMQLQGSPLGFKTDKTYAADDIRDVLIEAVIKGFRPVGNEINVIAGNLYIAKAGLQRAVSEWPGLSKLKLQPGVPRMVGETGALVPYTATWELDGVPDEIRCELTNDAQGKEQDRRIAVRVNKGQGADATLGKATSKMLKRIYERLAGNPIATEDDAGTIDGESTTIEETEDPAWGYEQRFAEAATIGAADSVMASTADLDWTDEQMARIRQWYKEALERLAASEQSKLTGVADRFARAQQIGDCNEIRDEAMTRGLSPTEFEILGRLHAEACNRIRAGRGGRGNER